MNKRKDNFSQNLCVKFKTIFFNSQHNEEISTVLTVTGLIPRFGPDTFLELEKLEDAYLTFEIDLALKIESPDGLILFTGQSDKIDADYISFGLKEGYPIFRYVHCTCQLFNCIINQLSSMIYFTILYQI